MNQYDTHTLGRHFVVFARDPRAAARTAAFHYWLLLTQQRRIRRGMV